MRCSHEVGHLLGKVNFLFSEKYKIWGYSDAFTVQWKRMGPICKALIYLLQIVAKKMC